MIGATPPPLSRFRPPAREGRGGTEEAPSWPAQHEALRKDASSLLWHPPQGQLQRRRDPSQTVTKDDQTCRVTQQQDPVALLALESLPADFAAASGRRLLDHAQHCICRVSSVTNPEKLQHPCSVPWHLGPWPRARRSAGYPASVRGYL